MFQGFFSSGSRELNHRLPGSLITMVIKTGARCHAARGLRHGPGAAPRSSLGSLGLPPAAGAAGSRRRGAAGTLTSNRLPVKGRREAVRARCGRPRVRWQHGGRRGAGAVQTEQPRPLAGSQPGRPEPRCRPRRCRVHAPLCMQLQRVHLLTIKVLTKVQRLPGTMCVVCGDDCLTHQILSVCTEGRSALHICTISSTV